MNWIISVYTFALGATTLVLAYLYFTRNFNYWKKRNVHFIKPIPFFGNLLPLFSMKQVTGEWLADICRQVNKDYFGIFFFDQPILMVKSPKLIKTILQKDFTYFQNRSVASQKSDPTTVHMMFFSETELWKPLRNNASPVFTTGKLKQMFPLILNEGEEMCKYIGRMAKVPNLESKEICAKYSTNVIAKCAFAVDAKSFENEQAEFRNLGRELFDFGLLNAFRQLSNFLAPNFAEFFNMRMFKPATLSRLKAIFMEVLYTRKASPTLKGNDLLDILIQADKKGLESSMVDHVMGGQALMFYVAGFETVSGALSFTLYEMCVQPEIQEKLRNEILENMSKNNDKLTYEGICEMKYLDMCVCEGLRKYPVLPFLDRRCTANYKLPGSDLVIEKGTAVYISTFELHYNPEYYPNPQKYDPERFADKQKLNSEGFTYIPFGEGPRICIGSRFGLLGVKIGLASILSRYEVVATDKTPIPMKFEPKSLVLQSTVGVPLQFVPLQKRGLVSNAVGA